MSYLEREESRVALILIAAHFHATTLQIDKSNQIGRLASRNYAHVDHVGTVGHAVLRVDDSISFGYCVRLALLTASGDITGVE